MILLVNPRATRPANRRFPLSVMAVGAALPPERTWQIVDGNRPDVDVLAQTDLGIQALASHPMKTDKRGIGDLNVAVTFGGVTFRPGEYVYADNNGIIVSPSALKMPE